MRNSVGAAFVNVFPASGTNCIASPLETSSQFCFLPVEQFLILIFFLVPHSPADFCTGGDTMCAEVAQVILC